MLFRSMDLVDVKLLETHTEVSSDNPLLNQYRNLAKIEFVLCHSLPSVNSNNASWTYPTLVNSVGTVKGGVINLNHLMRDNSEVLNKEVKNVLKTIYRALLAPLWSANLQLLTSYVSGTLFLSCKGKNV